MRVVATQDSGPKTVAGREPSGRPHARSGPGRAATSQGHAGGKAGRPFSDVALTAFFSNTATLLKAGVPLIKALEALVSDEVFARSVPTFDSLIRDIRAGASFSIALSRHPVCFSPMIVGLVRASEASGTLTAALERIAQNIETRRESRAQVRKALAYPTIVTVLGTAAVGFLMAFVVPVFEETYEKANMPLPAITVILIAISSVVAKTWWIAIITLISLALLYRHGRTHPRVQAARDRLLLRIPLVGPVFRTVVIGRFVQSFGSLLAAGVSIKESLALTERVVQNSEYAQMVRELRLAVTRGEGIGRKLGEYRDLVPPLLTQIITLGEQSGELGSLLSQAGHYIEKDLKRRTQQMSMLVEPVVTVAMAAAVGTVALAIYLPIFDMFKQVG